MSPVRIRLAPLPIEPQRRGRSGPFRPLTRYRARPEMRALALKLGMAAVVLLALPALATAANRYSLQGGCYALQDASGKTVTGGESIRLQATTLGRYLFYRPDHTFLAAQPDGSLAPATAPSPAADFHDDNRTDRAV